MAVGSSSWHCFCIIFIFAKLVRYLLSKGQMILIFASNFVYSHRTTKQVATCKELALEHKKWEVLDQENPRKMNAKKIYLLCRIMLPSFCGSRNCQILFYKFVFWLWSRPFLTRRMDTCKLMMQQATVTFTVLSLLCDNTCYLNICSLVHQYQSKCPSQWQMT